MSTICIHCSNLKVLHTPLCNARITRVPEAAIHDSCTPSWILLKWKELLYSKLALDVALGYSVPWCLFVSHPDHITCTLTWIPTEFNGRAPSGLPCKFNHKFFSSLSPSFQSLSPKEALNFFEGNWTKKAQELSPNSPSSPFQANILSVEKEIGKGSLDMPCNPYCEALDVSVHAQGCMIPAQFIDSRR